MPEQFSTNGYPQGTPQASSEEMEKILLLHISLTMETVSMFSGKHTQLRTIIITKSMTSIHALGVMVTIGISILLLSFLVPLFVCIMICESDGSVSIALVLS